MAVSIIIPTLNEEENIENLLNNSLVSYKTASDKAIWGKDKDAKKNIEIEIQNILNKLLK
mgnify:CR=1 FL=1